MKTIRWISLILCVCISATASAQELNIDLDGDGVSDTITIGSDATLTLSRAVGTQLLIQGLPVSSIDDIRVLPPADLDGDGALDLVISTPFAQSGRVWIFSGAASASGTIHATQATFCLQSSMPGAIQFGDAMGLLPGDSFGSPVCLRVRSLVEGRDGEMYPRVEVFRLDAQRLLLVAEGFGALTDVWSDRGDGTRDGKVDALDILMSLARVGSLASFDGDLDGDGIITASDISLLINEVVLASADANSDWSSVVQAMLTRPGGVSEWGMPILLVSRGPEAQPAPPPPSGTGVFYCARPIDGWYENWPWWLAPFCHAYLQIGDWTRSFGGSSPTENLNDGRSRKCWEAKKRTPER